MTLTNPVRSLKHKPDEEDSSGFGIPYFLPEQFRNGDIDIDFTRVLNLMRTWATFSDEEGNLPQVVLDFMPEDREGNDIPLLPEAGDYHILGKRIGINYTPTPSAIVNQSDQFEFARWLTEYRRLAALHGLGGRLELNVFYGEDDRTDLDTALVRVQWVFDNGELRLTQPWPTAY